MTYFAKLIGALVAVAALAAVAGLLLGWAWYHDDACTIEAWKCDLAGIGFALSLYAGLALVPLVAILAVSVAIAVGKRRPATEKHPPR